MVRVAAVSFLLTAVLLAAIGAVAYSRLQPRAAADRLPDVTVGGVAPDFTLADAATGAPVRLSDLRGRTVIVNFWATWCGPCRFELPALEEAYRNRGAGASGDFVVLAVNVRETGREVATFRESLEMTFPVLLDSTGTTFAAYGGQVLPQTYFVDRDGIVRGRHIGAFGPSDLARGLEWARE